MNLPFEGTRVGVANSEVTPGFLVPDRIVTPFQFRSLNGRETAAMLVDAKSPNLATSGDDVWPAQHDAPEQIASQAEAIEAARVEGFAQGEMHARGIARAEAQAELQALQAGERATMVSSIHAFKDAREQYFGEVEQEVVKLALAIAARVLNREAMIDPLLLAGAVRVALEKVADGSGVLLRVAPDEVTAWEKLFAETEPSRRPTVSGDGRLDRKSCVLETSMGRVELGVSVQLEEIEKGFFDMLNHRPPA